MNRMLQRILLFLCFIPYLLNAQEIEVRSCRKDNSATSLPVVKYDVNNEMCALIKVKTPAITNLVFKGNIIGEPEYKDGTYYIYVSHAKRLSYRHEDYLPGTVDFTKFNVNVLGGEVYDVELIVLGEMSDKTSSSKTILEVESNFPNASVYLDGEWIGETPLKKTEKELWPGDYNLEVRKDGYNTYREVITLSEKDTKKVKVEFNNNRFIRFNYNVYENVHLSIDGKYVGVCAENTVYDYESMKKSAPLSYNRVSLSPGKHQISIDAKGYEHFETEIEVTSESDSFDFILTPSSIKDLAFIVNGVEFHMKEVLHCSLYPFQIYYEEVKNDYYIGETEVTEALWHAVMGNENNALKESQKPVSNVSFVECQQFINRLNTITGKTFRLPTENEHGWASRGGIYNLEPQSLDETAWLSHNSDSMVHNVKQKVPNILGLYDLVGNVGEICTGNFSLDDERDQVKRGKSFQTKDYLITISKNEKSIDMGFRLVMDCTTE